MAAAPLQSVVDHLKIMTSAECGDAQLVERFVNTGDEAAFAAIVRRHGPLVHGVCRRLLGKSSDLEDVFQATFVVLARKAGSIRKRASVASWLYGVAYRLARKLKSRQRRHGEQ